jgi:ABC-type multidrug transport system fused ATPase/permease subunit
MAQLEKTVKEWPNGLDTQVGERGAQLSGGQNQRLGIARALFTNPKILVLDEATSALDSQTERDVGTTLDNLSGEITRVIIAHRLSTIQQADQILYLDNGKILAIGTFDQVRSKVPEFDLEVSRLQMK